MTRPTLSRVTVLGLWLVMVAFDPTGTYKNAVMVGGTLLPLLLILDGTRSPWLDWQGALPLDRSSWMKGEFAKTYGEQILLQGIFWALVALVKAGPEGWAGYGATHGGTILAGLTAVPWFVVQGLDPGDGPRDLWRPARLGVVFAVILVVAGLGTLWEESPGWPLLVVLALACGTSLALAWVRAKNLLFRGDL